MNVPPQHAQPLAVGLWRFLRASVVTVLVVGIAAAAHTAAGGHLPPLLLMVLLAALVMAPVAALSRGRLSLPVLAGILATGQGFLHVAFDALSSTGTDCGPAGIAAHSHHQDLTIPGCVTAGTAAFTGAAAVPGVEPAAMTTVHVLATALTVLALARAEAALWQLRSWLMPLIRTPQPVGLPAAVTVPISGTASWPWPVPGTRITAPRGPPPRRTLQPAH